MSKIICDVCGTAYAETASQCPICGCVRAVDPKVMHTEPEQQPISPRPGYTPVKGGRFSKANVKKRNNARKAEIASQEPEDSVEELDTHEKKQTDKGLLVAFIVLLLSIAAVVCYILVRFLGSGDDGKSGQKPAPGITPPSTTAQVEQGIACQDITISQSDFTLTQTGAVVMIEATLTPVDTTQELTFISADENIATVDNDGMITAVGAGQTVITITCGEVEKTCTVVCNFTSSQETTQPVVDDPGFELKASEVTLFEKGESYTLYEGDISATEITWKSSDEKIATVASGKVVAVSAGQAVITAQYNGKTLECVIYCSDSVGAYVDTDTPQTGNFTLNKTDVTIKVDETFVLKLRDEDRNTIEGCTFESDSKSKCTVTSSGTVKGVSAGKATITVTYGDQSYTCIVRVK